MFKKLLVPLDGSELAEGILPYVTQLANESGSPIVLVSVVDAADRTETAAFILKRYLEDVEDRLAAQEVEAESVVTVGRPAEQILRVAEREECDLIAMATHGRSAIGRGIFGSVTDKVMRASRLPTLAVAPERAARDGQPGVAVSTIVVPLDGSDLAETALPYAEELARELSLTVMLVRVIDTGGPYIGVLDDARFV